MKGGNSLLIHRMHLDDHYVVLDVNSGAVHIIDKMIYDILGFYDGNNPEETKAHFKGKYADSDVEEVLAELKELQEAGLLQTFPYPIHLPKNLSSNLSVSMLPMTATCAADIALPIRGTLAAIVPS